MTSFSSQSEWYALFIGEMKWRVGRISCTNQATSVEVIMAVIVEVGCEIIEADIDSERDWINFGTLLVLLLVGSLRGYKVLCLDLVALPKHLDEG